MPTYNYQCLDCKARFKRYLTYAEYDRAEIVCSVCGSSRPTTDWQSANC